MYCDYPETRISQNLSLRKSPERKYNPSLSSSSTNFYTSPICQTKYSCYPNRYCYSFCCDCCCCCCCCYSVCCRYPYLHYDYNSMNSSNDLNKRYKYLSNYKKDEENKKEENEQNNQNKEEQNNQNEEEQNNQNEEEQNNQNEEELINQNEEEHSEQNENINSMLNQGKSQSQNNQNPPNQNQNTYYSYEQNQFNDFLKKLMDVESKIEDVKIKLASNPDFNCEDVFRLFETYFKGYLNENDIKKGLNLIGVNATDQEIKLIMKRFDLQKSGHITFADFFDMIVTFEKNDRDRIEARNPKSRYPYDDINNLSPNIINGLKELFNLIINSEIDINKMRKTFGTLRLNLRDIFGLVDKDNKGNFTIDELADYVGNNHITDNKRDVDLLFIRLDKNRNGRIDFSEIEDEIQTLY